MSSVCVSETKDGCAGPNRNRGGFIYLYIYILFLSSYMSICAGGIQGLTKFFRSNYVSTFIIASLLLCFVVYLAANIPISFIIIIHHSHCIV